MELNSWNDVDAAIRRAGEIDITLERISGDATLKINEVKEDAKRRSDGLNAERKQLEKGIQAFCEARKDEFSRKRSKTLSFGSIGYRIVSKVSIPRDKGKVAALIKALRAFALGDCIKTEEKPDRDKIAELDDATIAKLGLKRNVTDSFRVQPDIEAVQNYHDAA